MAPPPPVATPSPNRFIFRKPNNKPASGAQQRPIKREGEDGASTSEPRQIRAQFAPIPRFSAPRTRAERAFSYPPRSPSPTRPKTATPGVIPPQQERHADTVLAKDEDEDDEMLDNEVGPIDLTILSPSTGDTITSQSDRASSPQSTSIHPPSPKRPRLAQPVLPQPSQQPAKPSTTRFIIPPSPSSAHVQSQRQTPFLAHPSPTQGSAFDHPAMASPLRPAFLKPSIPPPDVSASPLPEAFSPHRKGTRYVPGGMAAELSTWIIETGQAAVSSRRGKGYLQGNDFVREMKISSVKESGGIVFVAGIHGEGGEGMESKIVLAAAGEKREKIQEGQILGIRAPCWDVNVQGETWGVGVDWKVIR